jgi:hypothetical protein
MIQYKLQKDFYGEICGITIVGENISIPRNSENTDYQKYLEWLAEGNEPLPADEPDNP